MFDDFLSTRIGMGKSQYTSFLILSLIEFMMGFQEIFQALLIRILKTEWDISQSDQALLGALFFIGIMLGNFICSFSADLIGRRNILIMSQSSSILVMILNSMAQDFFFVALCVFFYGLTFGVSMPISQVMVSEIIPVQVRGIFLVLLQFIYILGILYVITLAYFFLQSFDQGDWRGLLTFNIAPASLCLIGIIFLLGESPRLLIYQKKFEQGFMLLDRMGKSNRISYENITEYEKTSIINDRNQIDNQVKTSVEQFKGLFQNYRITIFIWAIFLMYNVISCGLTIIIPYLLKDADSSFFFMFLAYASELPAILTVVFLIENKQYGGRIKCTNYGLLLILIIQLLLFTFKTPFLIAGLVGLRYGNRIVWSCLNALPTESYATAIRSMGVGAAQGIGKLSGSLTPFLVLYLYYQSNYLPFLFGSILCVLGIIIMNFYPIDMTQQKLDSQYIQEKVADENMKYNNQIYKN
ncbi:hypothetical protein pb186bvf_002936 [Paramecium bursaria]